MRASKVLLLAINHRYYVTNLVNNDGWENDRSIYETVVCTVVCTNNSFFFHEASITSFAEKNVWLEKENAGPNTVLWVKSMKLGMLIDDIL